MHRNNNKWFINAVVHCKRWPQIIFASVHIFLCNVSTSTFFHQVVKSISTLLEFELALRIFFDQENMVKLMLCDFWIQTSRVSSFCWNYLRTCWNLVNKPEISSLRVRYYWTERPNQQHTRCPKCVGLLVFWTICPSGASRTHDLGEPSRTISWTQSNCQLTESWTNRGALLSHYVFGCFVL